MLKCLLFFGSSQSCEDLTYHSHFWLGHIQSCLSGKAEALNQGQCLSPDFLFGE